MNAVNFRRVEKLARTGALVAEVGAHALNTLLEANNLNGNVETVHRCTLVTSAFSSAISPTSLSLRAECTTKDAHAIVVWINVNDNDVLEFDFS